jgi:cell division protein FtsI (penicillin-binding protein 3)
LVTMAFGQGLTSTAVQLAAAFGAIANDGVLMRPFLVSKLVGHDGLLLLENRPTEVRQVVSRSTARLVLSMLEGVVEREGTAPRAKMAEFRVAGKTGTAQKADPVARGYSDKRIASFVGIVPAQNPRTVILIVIDEPKTDVYGGLVAAPAFKEIATALMPYLGVPPTHAPSLQASAAPIIPGKEKNASPAWAGETEPFSDTAVTEQVLKGTVRIPDLQGAPARQAIAKLLAAALEPHVSGKGRVVAQVPPAGSLVPKGARVRLELAMRP